MKTNSSFPHPVLGINNDVNSDIAPEDMLQILDIEEKDSVYEYTFQLNQDNKQITDYIQEGHAKYVCEVDCSKTFYKEIHSSSDSKMVVRIEKNKVVGHIDFSFYVLTTCIFPRYTNQQFNSDYRDPETGALPSFWLDKGAVLALFPQWEDNVNVRFNNKPELSAFIQVVKRQDAENVVNIDLSGDIINIELPDDMYLSFLQYNHDEYIGLFYSSLVFNALVKGILNMDKYDGATWADSIKAIIEAAPDKFQGLSLDEPSDAVDIAMKMMTHRETGTPYELLFSSIENLQN